MTSFFLGFYCGLLLMALLSANRRPRPINTPETWSPRESTIRQTILNDQAAKLREAFEGRN